MSRKPTTTNRIFATIVATSVFGVVALTLTITVGFEEANSTLLLLSSVLVLATPTAVLLHLGFTRQLTGHDKRLWIQTFASAQSPWAFADYLFSDDRRAGARRQRRAANARRLRNGTDAEDE